MSDHGLIKLSATSRVGSYGVDRFIEQLSVRNSPEPRLVLDTTVIGASSVGCSTTVKSPEVTKSSSSTTAHHTSLN